MSRSSSGTEINLQRWYDGFNYKYFGNELPQDVVVEWGDLTKDEAMGRTWPSSPGVPHRIEIDRHWNVAQVTIELTLLHEMCHIEAEDIENAPVDEDPHGPIFQACMMSLAQHGALHDLW